jgi:hypothetical protein
MLQQLSAGDCFSWFSFPGGHGYPPVAQQYSFAWFDRWLSLKEPGLSTGVAAYGERIGGWRCFDW